nr:toprim domain-containing protein [Candidatus Woesearchaeota archaeon]
MISWIEALRNSNKLKIVEGKKDILALESFGIKNIKQIDKPLYSFIEEISSNNSEVIILTDLDPQGKKLYSILRHNLQKRKVKIDNYFREYLFKNTKLTQIEGIKSYVKKGYLL